MVRAAGGQGQRQEQDRAAQTARAAPWPPGTFLGKPKPCCASSADLPSCTVLLSSEQGGTGSCTPIPVVFEQQSLWPSVSGPLGPFLPHHPALSWAVCGPWEHSVLSVMLSSDGRC